MVSTCGQPTMHETHWRMPKAVGVTAYLQRYLDLLGAYSGFLHAFAYVPSYYHAAGLGDSMTVLHVPVIASIVQDACWHMASAAYLQDLWQH